MRILHTSDWHLGQNFYSKSRAAEHQAFLDWLLETAVKQQVDAIIVAGDIFSSICWVPSPTIISSNTRPPARYVAISPCRLSPPAT